MTTTIEKKAGGVPKFDSRAVQFSVLFYFGLLIPISIVHEAGHYVVCTTAGHESSIGITIRGMWTSCNPDLETLSFSIAGPAFGALASLAILEVGDLLRRRSTRTLIISMAAGLMVVGFAMTADQVLKIFLEGFMTDLYVGGSTDGVLTAFQIGSLAAGLFLFARLKK